MSGRCAECSAPGGFSCTRCRALVCRDHLLSGARWGLRYQGWRNTQDLCRPCSWIYKLNNAEMLCVIVGPVAALGVAVNGVGWQRAGALAILALLGALTAVWYRIIERIKRSRPRLQDPEP